MEVKEPAIREQVLEVLEAFRQDDVKGWEMQPDGSYRKASEPRGAASQERLYRYFTAQRIEAPAEKQSLLNRLSSWLRRHTR